MAASRYGQICTQFGLNSEALESLAVAIGMFWKEGISGVVRILAHQEPEKRALITENDIEELWNLMEDSPGLPANPIDKWKAGKGGDDAKQAIRKQLDNDLFRAEMATTTRMDVQKEKPG